MPDPVAPIELLPLAKPEHASHRVPWAMVAAAVIAGIVALLYLGHELNEGDGASFDRAVILAMRVSGHPETPIGPAWLPSAMRDLTALGSSIVLTLIVAMTTLFLGLRGRWRSAAIVVASTSLGAAMVTLVKALVGRARPDLVERLMVEMSQSFPSGHAANSAIVYLTLATLLFPLVPERRLRGFLLGVALLLTGLVGISRVYLGVHWPSDVIAGWAFGSLWALLWWQIELRVLRAQP